MTDQLPKEFFVWSFNDWGHWAGYARTTSLHPLDDKERETGVLCIPKAEAEAMVAAAYKKIKDNLVPAMRGDAAACAKTHPEISEDRLDYADMLEEILSLAARADARAAFEQAVQEAEQRGWARGMEAKVHFAAEAAVQEAVAAERERLTEALTLIERTYYMEGKDAKWRAAHMNGIARDAQNGLNLAWAKRMFPRDGEALSEARKVHAEEAAAMRDPQETNE